MKKILDGLRAALLLAGIALLIATTAAVIEVRSFKSQISGAIADLHSISLNTTRTEAEMAGLLNAQRHAIADEKKFLDDADGLLVDVRGQVDSAGKQYADTLAAVRTGVTQDSNAAAESAKSLDLALNDIAKQTGDAVAQASASVSDAAEAVKVQAASPAIANALANVDHSTAQLAVTSDDIRKAADFELKRITAPVSFAKRTAQFIASLAGKFFNF